MERQSANNQNSCPRADIIAYLDGELNPRAEMNLELHFASCQICSRELNEQKKLLCALDFALDGSDEIELPKDFTKVVLANAESHVKGLRCPRERTRALVVCAVLFSTAVIILGAEISQTFSSFGTLTEQFLAVGGFFAHLLHDIAIAATVVLRSFCLQFVFKSSISIFFLGICFAISFLIFSRLISRFRQL